MLIDEGLELLTKDQAFDLLDQAEVSGWRDNRCAARDLSVNYRMIDGPIVFRTAHGSKLTAATDGAVVAFEVDDHDRVHRAGWSVLVVGQSEVVHDLDVTFKVLDADLEPYAEGARTAIVRIQPSFVSGRWITHGDHAPAGSADGTSALPSRV